MGCGTSTPAVVVKSVKDDLFTLDQINSSWLHRKDEHMKELRIPEMQPGSLTVIKLIGYCGLFNRLPLLNEKWLGGRLTNHESDEQEDTEYAALITSIELSARQAWIGKTRSYVKFMGTSRDILPTIGAAAVKFVKEINQWWLVNRGINLACQLRQTETTVTRGGRKLYHYPVELFLAILDHPTPLAPSETNVAPPSYDEINPVVPQAARSFCDHRPTTLFDLVPLDDLPPPPGFARAPPEAFGRTALPTTTVLATSNVIQLSASKAEGAIEWEYINAMIKLQE